jgi:phosphatidylserine/phosphatidylglycerophosphate/cardiolipin synthase-like enzyme
MAVDVHWFLPAIASGTFRERWPYGPGPAFHPDLGIELDGTARAATLAVAPVTGQLIVLPDLTLKTCGVFLIPGADATEALAFDGIGELAFYLRTLDLDDLVKRFKSDFAANQVDNLRKGLWPIEVLSGFEIALFAPEAPGQQRGLVQFEVLFAPRRGSHVGFGRAITYAKRLIDPANRHRRIDPMAFYYLVKRGLSRKTRIATAHINHPFWTTTALTRRGLFEFREERDRPFDTTLDIDISGTSTTVALTAANWAHHQVAAPGASGTVDVKVTKTSWRLTRLPGQGSSFKELTDRDAEVPFHWAVQSIYMADVDNPASWFVANTSPLPRFTERNTVTPLIDGEDTFKEIVKWLKRVQDLEQFIWLAGWWGEHDFEMVKGDPDSTFGKLATAAAAKASVRVMMWKQPFSAGLRATTAFVDHINKLPNNNGKAILDAQTLKFGSHHQKFMVVFLHSKDAAAFCGGVDINPNRLDNAEHKVKNGPYHDVHAILRGPTVKDFMRLFIERWNDHNDVGMGKVPALPSPPGTAIDETLNDCFVQVTRTIPKSTHRSQPAGVKGTLNAIRRAAQRAEQYIYIEDQYLTPYWGHVPFEPAMDLGIVKDLIDAMARIKFLLIVIPNHVTTFQNRYRRHEFLESLKRGAGDHASKLHVYYLARPRRRDSTAGAVDVDTSEAKWMNGGTVVPPEFSDELETLGEKPGASGTKPYDNEIYLHTKVWLVDDVYVKCGSMNFNRRGFTYDTEADFHAVDGAVKHGKRPCALEFRKQLFAEHGRAKPEDVPDSPEDALAWWLDHVSKGRVKKYDWSREKGPGPGRARKFLDDTWREVIDPDGS